MKWSRMAEKWAKKHMFQVRQNARLNSLKIHKNYCTLRNDTSCRLWDLCLVETAYWNDYYLKRKGKSSVESNDLSAACESFNSGNEINRKLKKSQVFTFKRTQFQDISHPNSNSLHKVNSRLYFDEILHNH